MIKVKIDDRQIMDFAKKSPARSRWALSEALKMTGGHFRKKLRAFIEGGGENWPPGHPLLSHGRTPLYNLGALVRFRYSRTPVNQRVFVGFFREMVGRMTTNKGDRRGMYIHNILTVISKVQAGHRMPVTEGLRSYMATHKFYLKKTTKFITVPPRPIFEPFLRREERNMLTYMEGKFFDKFFSNERSKIAY